MLSRSIKQIARRLQGAPRPRDGRQTVKDKALAHRLRRTFEHDLELASVGGIHFYVQNETVTLYGAIRHELDRALLVSLVQRIPGVKGVVEELQIVDPVFQEDQPTLSIRF